MSLPDLHWIWIAGPIIAAVLLGMMMMMIRRRRRDPYGRRSRSTHDHGSAYGQDPGLSQSGGQQMLVQAVKEVRNALDKQAKQMEALRAFWSQRLDELDGKIGALAPAQPGGRESAPERRPEPNPDFGYAAGSHPESSRDPGGYAAPYDAEMYGAESLGRPLAGADRGIGDAWSIGEPAWSPGPGDQPVEVRDGVLVVSRSLPPAGYLSITPSGEARVYLNADTPLTEFSLPKWAAFFELPEGKAYAAYRTRRPAAVRWDEATGRGELISKGLAEAI
ncbi:MAG TPA: hypothetical protein VLK84_09635 [Longimicrobium sp.]|nr:hypothetical protein [Longimicrobium sp.]